MIEYCICGHSEKIHQEAIPEAQLLSICFECGNSNTLNEFHNFKLDNLKLVEDLAKERNLI